MFVAILAANFQSRKKVYILTMAKELPAQTYLARLSNKPGLAAINGLISSFPVAKVFASNAVPLMIYRNDKKKK